jgi:hypothetical protein
MPSEKTETTPRQFGESTPPQYAMVDYSFTLQAVMELQKSVGQLTARFDEFDKKLDRQSDKLDRVNRQMYAAWAVLIVLGVIGGFLINHLWGPISNLLAQALKESPH